MGDLGPTISARREQWGLDCDDLHGDQELFDDGTQLPRPFTPISRMTIDSFSVSGGIKTTMPVHTCSSDDDFELEISLHYSTRRQDVRQRVDCYAQSLGCATRYGPTPVQDALLSAVVFGLWEGVQSIESINPAIDSNAERGWIATILHARYTCSLEALETRSDVLEEVRNIFRHLSRGLAVMLLRAVIHAPTISEDN